MRRPSHRHARRRALAAMLACALGSGPIGAAARPPATLDGTASAGSSPEGDPSAAEPADADATPPPDAPAEAPATTTMTDEQRRLHASGEAAARAGDWPAAARYFRAALAFGAFNLGFLGLGEALARQGRCAEAATTLDAVPSSPAVPEAPARFADAMANAQRQALGRTCPGRLVVDCAAPMTRYRIIGGAEHTCGEPLELPAGRYRLRAGPETMAVTLDAWVVGVETTRVTLRLPRPLPAEMLLGPTTATPAEASSGWSTAGGVVLAVGGVTLLAGGGLHAATLDAFLEAEDAADGVPTRAVSIEDAEAAYGRHADLRRATIVVYAVGGLLALGGLSLIWADPGEGPGRKPGSSLSWGPGWVGGRF